MQEYEFLRNREYKKKLNPAEFITIIQYQLDHKKTLF